MKRNQGVGRVGMLLMVVMLAGCCTAPREAKPDAKVLRERGWIGGQYEAVGQVRHARGMGYAGPLPKPLRDQYRRGVLLTALGSNAPARLAGLREGDLILELNHHAISNGNFFFDTIDHASPGSPLSVTAWRDGQTVECDVTVGREKWKSWGTVTVLPAIIGPLDLWPNPGFSLIVAGYEQGHPERHEIDGVRNRYALKYGMGEVNPIEVDWWSWLAVVSVQKGKTIVSQEPVPPNK